jgi:hypothetical protein
MTDEAWSLPRIKLVFLPGIRNHTSLSAEAKATRMNVILQMLHPNTLVHTIELLNVFNDEAAYHHSILPRLEMNRSCFEVQRQALKRAGLSIRRPRLLGRALYVFR